MPGCPGAREELTVHLELGLAGQSTQAWETCTKACSGLLHSQALPWRRKEAPERSSGFLKVTQQVKCSAWLRSSSISDSLTPAHAFLISWGFRAMMSNLGEMV